jgi:hypothetical protein
LVSLDSWSMSHVLVTEPDEAVRRQVRPWRPPDARPRTRGNLHAQLSRSGWVQALSTTTTTTTTATTTASAADASTTTTTNTTTTAAPGVSATTTTTVCVRAWRAIARVCACTHTGAVCQLLLPRCQRPAHFPPVTPHSPRAGLFPQATALLPRCQRSALGPPLTHPETPCRFCPLATAPPLPTFSSWMRSSRRDERWRRRWVQLQHACMPGWHVLAVLATIGSVLETNTIQCSLASAR